MREPRPHQRMPEGGKRLYELLRLDHEPGMITVFVSEETTRERLRMADTLGFSREFDPVLYFWPVEGQHCHVHLMTEEAAFTERLVRALLRDGALWVTVAIPRVGGGRSHSFVSWGDPNAFWRRHYGTESPVGALGAPEAGG